MEPIIKSTGESPDNGQDQENNNHGDKADSDAESVGGHQNSVTITLNKWGVKLIIRSIHSGQDKLPYLLETLQRNRVKTIVFVNCKYSTLEVAQFLIDNALSINYMHNYQVKKKRSKILDDFLANKFRILVGTSGACCALKEMCKVEHVINYELPSKKSHYLFRLMMMSEMNPNGLMTNFYEDRRDKAIYYKGFFLKSPQEWKKDNHEICGDGDGLNSICDF